METIQALVPLIFTASLAALIVAVGMDADIADLTSLFRQPLRLVKAIVAVNFIVPAAAILIVFLLPLSPIAKAGVLLMAVSPVPPLVPGKELKAGAHKSYAYGLYVALILLAVVIVPLAVALLSRIYGVAVSLPLALVARNVALTVLIPLAVGLAVRRLAPALAARAVGVVRTAAMVLLVVALVPMLIAVWPAMMDLIGNGTVLAMALVAVIAIAGGHLLGGPGIEDRAALAMTAATRHPGIALMIVSANDADKRINAAILGFMLVGLIVAAPYQIWLKRRRAHAAPVTAA